MFRNAHPGTVIFFGVLAAALYAVVLAGPLYVDNLDIREAVAVAHRQAGEKTDDHLRSLIQNRTRAVGSHWEEDEQGQAHVVPGLGLTEEQILIERDPYTTSVRIAVEYERHVRLVPTSRYWTLDFGAEQSGIPGQGK
jgi:hypothetical protein